MTSTGRPVDNGVNVQALLDARTALSAAPEAAQFTWRAGCTWRSGAHSQSTVAGFTGLGEQRLRGDHGPVQHRRRRVARRPGGAAGPGAEALGGLRRRDQPDQGARRAGLTHPHPRGAGNGGERLGTGVETTIDVVVLP